MVETIGSSLGIRFDDGTVFSMSAGTKMVINHLVYDPHGSSNSALFSVLKGTFTMVGGKIVDTGDMKVTTPIATLGIRGSNLIAVAVNTHEGWIGTNAVDPNGTPSEIEVLHQAHPGIYEVIGRLTDLFSVVAYTSTGEAVVLPSTPEQRALAEHLFDTLKQFYELHPELQPQSAPEFLTPDFFQKIDFGPTGVPTELLLQQALVIPSSVLAQLEEVGAQDFSLQTPTPQQVLLQQVLTLLQPPPVPPAIIPNSPPVITVELAGAAPTADTASASLTETDAGLQTTGTLTVTDANLFDVVTASVTGVTLGGTTGPLLPGDVQGFLTVTGGPIAADPGATNNLAWAFDSGTQAFDFLAAGEILTLTYTVTATDGSLTTEQSVTITITGTNDAPVVGAIGQTDLNEQTDTSLLTANIPVTFSDVDLNDVGHTATVTGVVVTGAGASGLTLSESDLVALVTPGLVAKAAGSANGAVDLAFSADSTVFDYLAAGETVTLTYTIAINDGDGGITPQTFVVQVTGTNDAPVAVADTLSATEDTAVIYTAAQLLGNDTDVDNSDLSIASVTSGTGGTAVLNADGTVTFTPDANFNGAANFSYTVSDGDLTSAPATATINVTPVNDAPVNTVPPPTEQPLTVAEDTDLSITGLLISDVDAGSANTITTTLSVLHGTLSVGGDVVDGAGVSTTKPVIR